MKRIIDIHSHILPYVDDGCGSAKEALEMLRMYEQQNVEAVICTPHYGPCSLTGADVNASFKWLSSTGSNVNLFLGNEILNCSFTLSDVRENRARTMAGSDYILIEFEDWLYITPANEILYWMKQLVRSEFKPILAHPERYEDLQRHPNYYKKLFDMGVLFQVNAYDIVENSTRSTVNVSRFLLKTKMASFIGSDAHGSTRRPPALETGVRWIYENCPKEYADAVVHDNAEKIIGGA